MLLRQVQAGPFPRHHLRALRGRGHAVQGPPRAHGPYRAGRARRPHLVSARHPQLAGLPAHGYRSPRGAQGQAAGEGHLLRRQPGHLGGRGEAPPRAAQRRGRAGRGAGRDRAGPRPRAGPPLQGPRGRAGPHGGRGRQGLRAEGPTAPGGQGAGRHPRAGRRRARPGQADLRRIPQPALAQDHRGRAAVAGTQGPLRRLLPRRHGRRGHRQPDQRDRLRRGGDQAPRRHRPERRPPAPLGAAPPEGHQAAEDRLRLQPPRRARPAGQRPPGHDPRRGAGDPARAAAHGAARRRPLRHVGPQRPVPPGHQPQQPPQAAPGSRRPRDHRQQREAHAPGGRRRPLRQRPPGPPGHRARQPAAEVAVGHAQGQAGPVPPEPARQAGRLLGPVRDRGRVPPSSCTSAGCRSRWRWSCSSRSS